MGRRVKPDYIPMRINQLLEDRDKAHDEYDKLWYNRIIQELDWVQQAQGRKFRRKTQRTEIHINEVQG